MKSKQNLVVFHYFVNIDCCVEPQKGIPWEQKGVELKILSAGRDRSPATKVHSRKFLIFLIIFKF